MTQKSYPWSGVAPASGADAGRYTNEEWTAVWTAIMRVGGIIVESPLLRTLAANTNRGVFYAVGNQLEVTNPGAAANTLQIDTGACLVEGQFHYNDTAVTFTIPSSKSNDLVVVRRNYTASTFTPGDSVDADEQVPPYTSRITRLDIGGGDAFTQDTTRATYWDTPLADISTDGAGAVTINSDDREYVDAMTKTISVPYYGGENFTDGTQLEVLGARGWLTEANKLSVAYANWMVPDDFISDMVAQMVVSPSVGSGNVALQHFARSGSCGELYDTNLDQINSDQIVAVTLDELECVMDLDIIGAARGGLPTVGDIIGFSARRTGTNGSDNVTNLGLVCELVTYFGWRYS